MSRPNMDFLKRLKPEELADFHKYVSKKEPSKCVVDVNNAIVIERLCRQFNTADSAERKIMLEDEYIPLPIRKLFSDLINSNEKATAVKIYSLLSNSQECLDEPDDYLY